MTIVCHCNIFTKTLASLRAGSADLFIDFYLGIITEFSVLLLHFSHTRPGMLLAQAQNRNQTRL